MTKKISVCLSVYIIFCLLFVILAGCTRESAGGKIKIGNKLFIKQFIFSTQKAGDISVIYKNSDSTLLNYADVPYFEFIIDNKLTTSKDKLWIYKSHSVRSMENGGKEHTLIFSGIKEHVNGLDVVIIQQVFPKSTLIREKLLLKTRGDKKFCLNKCDGKLHFKYPQYAIDIDVQPNINATEIRLASWEQKPVTFAGGNGQTVYNHMFYPLIKTTTLNKESNETVKGPINIINANLWSWMTTYEHASQDNTKGLLKKTHNNSGKIVDAMQGIKGTFQFKTSDEDFKFLGIHYDLDNTKKRMTISVDMLRGGYLDGEWIDESHPFETVWNTSSFYKGNNLKDGKKILHHYLLHQICEKSASRKPFFYYNTWGMQREISARTNNYDTLRGVFTYEQIFKEIDYAAQLGVDLFVLDDGWEQTQGIWKAHHNRLPQGLSPIKKRLDKYGMKMGVWLSPMGIDSTTQRFKQHNKWVIKDSEGKPVLAQWNHPAFDFVSGFFDVFISDCKKLIDEGAVFFKFDAINTFYSTLPNLYHGSDKYTDEEIRARYEYLLPIYVTRAMKILTDYEPKLVIEIDVTEARRVMMGLAPLSYGKLFFMNNGASGYNDYSAYRTKSMRTIPNTYNEIIPLELFTYATYPHNIENRMHYNVNTSLIAGHGFWGNLALTTMQQRQSVRKKVNKSKLILPYLVSETAKIVGNVGHSPEIYTQVNATKAAGQVIVFSEKAMNFIHNVKVGQKYCLGVLNTAYQTTDNDSIALYFEIPEDRLTAEAFIIPSGLQGISMCASSCAIDSISLTKNDLQYKVSAPGTQEIVWNKKYGKPLIDKNKAINAEITESENKFTINVVVQKANAIVKIKKR